MDRPRKFRLGWTHQQYRDTYYDHRHVRPYGGLITKSAVGILILAGMIIQMPQALYFFAVSLILGAIIALGLWLFRR